MFCFPLPSSLSLSQPLPAHGRICKLTCLETTFHWMKCCHGNTTYAKMSFLLWSCQDVAKWIESLGFPQYTACFTENFITGKKLVYVNCHYLPRLGITDFEHMKAISSHVHELLGISEPLWSRSIADPPRDDIGMFLEVKSRTGKRADSLTYAQYLNYQKK